MYSLLFISAIKSIIDADMARQQRVYGVFFRIFMLFKIDFRVPLISENENPFWIA